MRAEQPKPSVSKSTQPVVPLCLWQVSTSFQIDVFSWFYLCHHLHLYFRVVDLYSLPSSNMERSHAPGGFNVKQSEDDAGGVAWKYFRDNRWEVKNENDGDYWEEIDRAHQMSEELIKGWSKSCQRVNMPPGQAKIKVKMQMKSDWEVKSIEIIKCVYKIKMRGVVLW